MYLKAGLGDPCAGQMRAKDPPSSSEAKLRRSFRLDSLGGALPIGSTRDMGEIEGRMFAATMPLNAGMGVLLVFYLWPTYDIDLNEGRGDPWAGQVRATSSDSRLVKISPSVAKENFGLAPPMGSGERYLVLAS